MPFGTRKYGTAAAKRSRRLQLERSRESKSEKGDSAPAAPAAAGVAGVGIAMPMAPMDDVSSMLMPGVIICQYATMTMEYYILRYVVSMLV